MRGLMTDDNPKDRIDQVKELLALFELARGRPLQSPEELFIWLETAEGKAATREFDKKLERRYLAARVAKTLEEFERHKGRPPRTPGELSAWRARID